MKPLKRLKSGFLAQDHSEADKLKFCYFNAQKFVATSNANTSKCIAEKSKKIKSQVLETKPELKTRAESRKPQQNFCG